MHANMLQPTSDACKYVATITSRLRHHKRKEDLNICVMSAIML